ncbi:MAG: ABC transporter ATP-binding protein [Sedimentisphaerales bacterium]
MVCLENVIKTYRTRKGNVKALDGINLQVKKGEFVVIRGPSGSGKTTLLMTIGGMLRPTSGTVSVGQENLYAMSIRQRAKFRAQNIGFVFQMFYLVPYLSVTENVVLAAGTTPDWLVGSKKRYAQADKLIRKFGLAGRNYHKPSQLSAGEQQRTAIARALLNRPRIILADEPTGNLDPDNAATVLSFIADFHRDGGTVILATHGPAAQQFADRIIHLRNGNIYH